MYSLLQAYDTMVGERGLQYPMVWAVWFRDEATITVDT